MSVRNKTIVIHGFAFVFMLIIIYAIFQVFFQIQNTDIRTIISFFICALILVGLVTGIIFYIIIKMFLTRLKYLNTCLTNLSNSRDLNARIIIPCNDEFSELAQSINRILAEINRYQEDLAAEKERLSVTLRSIGEGVIATDSTGKIALINKTAEKLTGWSQAEAIGLPLAQVFTTISDPINDTEAHILNTKEGSERIISFNSAPIRDSKDMIIGLVLVFQDISEKQQLEEERIRTQKLESIGILAGGIAHDFNNILTGFLTNIQLTKIRIAQQKNIADYLNKMEESVTRAVSLTKQLLTFSKGGMPIKVTTSLIELIKDTSDFALIGSKAGYQFEVPDELWPAEIDPDQISQVIHNLVINADQAMPKGGIINITAYNVSLGANEVPGLSAGRYIRIAVRDQGIGIPEEYRSKIFDPYFTTKTKGNGLGLITSYSIIKRHNGSITFESTLGVGTAFYIYLPASANRNISKVEKKPIVHQGNGKILIMDDEAIIREMTGEMLLQLGYQVEFAMDGLEMINIYQRAKKENKPFDLVLMDLTIPGGMGGAEAISKLLRFDPGVRAIVCSGYYNDPVMADYKKYGFSGIITKPYKIEELSLILADLINHR